MSTPNELFARLEGLLLQQSDSIAALHETAQRTSERMTAVDVVAAETAARVATMERHVPMTPDSRAMRDVLAGDDHFEEVPPPQPPETFAAPHTSLGGSGGNGATMSARMESIEEMLLELRSMSAAALFR